MKPFIITVTGASTTPVATTESSTKIAAINVTAPKESLTLTPFDMTVSIVNSAGQVIPSYTGTVYLGTNNLEADVIFPVRSYTFTAADK